MVKQANGANAGKLKRRRKKGNPTLWAAPFCCDRARYRAKVSFRKRALQYAPS